MEKGKKGSNLDQTGKAALRDVERLTAAAVHDAKAADEPEGGIDSLELLQETNLVSLWSEFHTPSQSPEQSVKTITFQCPLNASVTLAFDNAVSELPTDTQAQLADFKRALQLPNLAEKYLLLTIITLQLIQKGLETVQQENADPFAALRYAQDRYTAFAVCCEKERNLKALHESNSIKDQMSAVTQQAIDTVLPALKRLLKNHFNCFDFASVFEYIETSVSIAAGSLPAGSEAFVVVGESGAGKSTILTYLKGKTELVADVDGRPIAKPESDPGPFKIGSGVTSETTALKFAKIRALRGSALYGGDTPGFGDTGGLERTVGNAFALIEGLRNVTVENGFRIVLVVSAGNFGARASETQGLPALLPPLYRQFPALFYTLSHLSVVITGAGLTADRFVGQAQDLLEKEAASDLGFQLHPDLKHFLTMIKGDPDFKKRVYVCNPLAESSISPDDLIKGIYSTTPICDFQHLTPYLEQADEPSVARQIEMHASFIEVQLRQLSGTTVLLPGLTQEVIDNCCHKIGELKRFLGYFPEEPFLFDVSGAEEDEQEIRARENLVPDLMRTKLKEVLTLVKAVRKEIDGLGRKLLFAVCTSDDVKLLKDYHERLSAITRLILVIDPDSQKHLRSEDAITDEVKHAFIESLFAKQLVLIQSRKSETEQDYDAALQSLAAAIGMRAPDEAGEIRDEEDSFEIVMAPIPLPNMQAGVEVQEGSLRARGLQAEIAGLTDVRRQELASLIANEARTWAVFDEAQQALSAHSALDSQVTLARGRFQEASNASRQSLGLLLTAETHETTVRQAAAKASGQSEAAIKAIQADFEAESVAGSLSDPAPQAWLDYQASLTEVKAAKTALSAVQAEQRQAKDQLVQKWLVEQAADIDVAIKTALDAAAAVYPPHFTLKDIAQVYEALERRVINFCDAMPTLAFKTQVARTALEIVEHGPQATEENAHLLSLTLGDPLQFSRVKSLLKWLELSDVKALRPALLSWKNTLNDLVSAVGPVDDIKNITNLIESVLLLQKGFGLWSGDLTPERQLPQRFDQMIQRLSGFASEALKFYDYRAVIWVLDQLTRFKAYPRSEVSSESLGVAIQALKKDICDSLVALAETNGTLADVPAGELTESKTQHWILLFQSFNILSNSSFAGDIERVYSDMEKELRGFARKVSEAFLPLVKGNEIAAIERIPVLLKQMWLVLSVPAERVKGEAVREYNQLVSSLKTFLTRMTTTFTNMLNVDSLISAENHEDLKVFLTLLAKPDGWLALIDYQAETIETAIGVLLKRVERLSKRLASCELSLDSPQKLVENDWVCVELSIISDCYASVLSKDQLAACVAAREAYRLKVQTVTEFVASEVGNGNASTVLYQRAPTEASVGLFNTAWLQQAERFFTAYYKTSLLPAGGSPALNGVHAALLHLLKDSLARFNASLIVLFAQILERQSLPQQEPAPDVTNLVEGVRVYAEQLRFLSGCFSGRDSAFKDAFEAFVEKIAANIKAFGPLLRASITQIVQAEEKQAGSEASGKATQTLSQRIALCSALIPLDVYLSTSAEVAPKTTYEKLHNAFTKELEANAMADVKSVLSFFLKGEYSASAQAASENTRLAVGGVPWQIISRTISDAVKTRFLPILNQLVRLSKEPLGVKSAYIEALNEDQDYLASLEPLLQCGLVTTSVSKAIRNYKTNQLPAAVQSWFEQMLSLSVENIKSFDLYPALEQLCVVSVLAEKLTQKPTNYQHGIESIYQSIVARVTAVTAGFSAISVLKWPKAQKEDEFPVNVVSQALQACVGEPAIGEFTFAGALEDFSQQVMLSMQRACAQVARELESQALNLQGIFQQVEQLLAVTQGVEPQALQAKVVAEITALVTTLQAMLLNPDVSFGLTQRLEYLCYFLDLQPKLANLASLPLDNTSLIHYVGAIATDNLQRLKAGLEAQECPAEAISLIHRLNGQFSALEVVARVYEEAQVSLINACDTGSQCLTRTLNAYRARHAFADQKEMLGSLAAQMRLLLALIALDVEGMIDAAALKSQLLTFVPSLQTLYQDNVQLFETARNGLNAEKMMKALQFSFVWQPVSEQVLSVLGLQAAVEPLKDSLKNLKESVLANSAYTLRDDLAHLISNANSAFTALSLSAFTAMPEKTEAALKKQFEDLLQQSAFAENLQACLVSPVYADLVGSVASQAPSDVSAKHLGEYFGELLAKVDRADLLTGYLVALLQAANDQLGSDRDLESANWALFSACYLGLSAFAQAIPQHKVMGELVLRFSHGEPFARTAVEDLKAQFVCLLSVKLTWIKAHLSSEIGHSGGWALFINHLLALQSMRNQLPAFSDLLYQHIEAVLDFVNASSRLGDAYISTLATDLEKERSGLGREIIDAHSHFKHISIALRNMRTKAVGVDRILDEMTTCEGEGYPRHLNPAEKEALKAKYEEFAGCYKGYLDKALKPDVDFNNPHDPAINALKGTLLRFVSGFDKPTLKADLVWTAEVKAAIPQMMAVIFTLWTLKDAQAYFKSGSSEDSLKQPHPAQILAIFRMLNVADAKEKLDGHFTQVLTGEGKSIIMATVNIILALLGYDVSSACYSEYLSTRDQNDFSALFKWLGVQEHIHYGTIDQLLVERVLNEKGDLRELTEAQIMKQNAILVSEPAGAEEGAAVAAPSESRPRIANIDEVDIFFGEGFTGFYAPSFVLGDPMFSAFLDECWQVHSCTQQLFTLTNLKKWPAYQAVEEHLRGKLGDYVFLFGNAVMEIISVLNKAAYRRSEAHAYILKDGVICYPYQDGYAANQDKGYQTLFAYYNEKNIGSAVNSDVFNAKKGMVVTCGIFSYMELFKAANFVATMGVTGTLDTMLPSQVQAIAGYGVRRRDFLPSAYGERQVANLKSSAVGYRYKKDDYHALLTDTIKKRRVGVSDDKVERPVIVFFETREALLEYYNAPQAFDLKPHFHLMSERASGKVAQDDEEIKLAMTAGSITLALSEYARGRDSVCWDKDVLRNGGPVVLAAYLPLDFAMQRQQEGRTGRCGTDGYFGMVICGEDLSKVYKLDARRLDKMRDESFYLRLHGVREKMFEATYTARLANVKKLAGSHHNDAMRLRDLLMKEDSRVSEVEAHQALALLQIFNAAPVCEAGGARKAISTAILVDVTGSMGPLIRSLKLALRKSFQALQETLKKQNIVGAREVLMQVIAYRSYRDIQYQGGPFLECSGVTHDPKLLSDFVARLIAIGGNADDGYEAGELPLQMVLHQYQHAIKEGTPPPTEIIVLGDAPFTRSLKFIQNRRDRYFFSKYLEKQSGYQAMFVEPKHCSTLARALADAGIPIHARAVSVRPEDGDCAYKGFDKDLVSNMHGQSTVDRLVVDNVEKAAKRLSTLFGDVVLTRAAGGNKALKDDLMEAYITRCGASK